MLQKQQLSKLNPVSFNPYAYAIKPINVWRKIALGFVAMHIHMQLPLLVSSISVSRVEVMEADHK